MLFVLGPVHAAVALAGLTADARVLIQYVPAARFGLEDAGSGRLSSLSPSVSLSPDLDLNFYLDFLFLSFINL
jgi:hypothetical protein